MAKNTEKEMDKAIADYTIVTEGLEIMIEQEKKDDKGYAFRMLRMQSGMNRTDFADWLGIPYRTMTEWERGTRQMPDYVFRLIAYKVANEKLNGNI